MIHNKKDSTVLSTFKLFHSKMGSSFDIPDDHKELFVLIRQSDFFGVDNFLEAASIWWMSPEGDSEIKTRSVMCFRS